MTKKINLLDFTIETEQPALELVRLDGNETVLIPFTSESEEVQLHYCSEPDINTYILCNEDDCVLCRVGRKKDRRLLLPVYLPASGTVGVLQVSPSLRPYALLPQILNVLKAEKPMVAFVSRENNNKYHVDTNEITKDMDGGEAAIKNFQGEYINKEYSFSSLYQRIDNEQLRAISEIARILQLKGLE